MKQLWCICFLLLLNSNLFSQNTFTLSGNVNDKQGEPLLYGDIVLLSPTDSLPLKYTYIQQGHFQLDPYQEGEYLLKISCLGYDKILEPVSLNKDMTLDFTLSENTTELAEAMVTARRNTISNKDGNIMVNVANSIFAAQASTMDLLAQLPTLLVDPNRESVSVIGKGSPLIYLENQRITVADLNSIPVATIKSIEIINNPSARYEAEGRAVILITRIANLSDGYNIQLSENASFRQTFSNFAGVNANFKKNKLELRTNFAYNAIRFWEKLKGSDAINSQNLQIDRTSLSIGDRPQFVIGGGLHYQINKGDYISAQANTRFFTDNGDLETNSLIQQGQETDAVETFSEDSSDRSFFTSNINYNKKLKASNLFMGLQYSKYSRDLDSEISNNFNDTEFLLSQNRYQKYTIDAYSFRTDFEKKIQEIKWETGINIYYADALALQDFEFLNPPLDLISNYDYLEQNYAAYLQASGSINKMTYTAGLRSETTIVEGGFRNSDTLVIDRTNPVLFPRLNLNIPIDSTKTLTLNYSKSIRRPNYLNASSITTFINPNIEYTRNANLRSTISQELSLNFQFNTQSIILSYTHSKYPVNTSIVYDPVNDRLISSPDNFDQESGYSIRFVSPLSYKFWNTTNVAMLSLNKLKDERATSFEVKPYLYFYSGNRFTLSPTAHFNINLFGISRRYTGAIIQEPIFSASVGISKRFKKLTASVNYSDIFSTMNWESRYTINQINNETFFFGNATDLNFSLRYSFGKISKSNYKNKDVDDNINRMR